MIEQNIFQSWYTRILNPLIQKEIDEFKGINSEYNYYLYTDGDIDNL